VARRISSLVSYVSGKCRECESTLSFHHKRWSLDYLVRRCHSRAHSSRCRFVAHVLRNSVFERFLAFVGWLPEPFVFARRNQRDLSLSAAGNIRIFWLDTSWSGVARNCGNDLLDRQLVSAMVSGVSQAGPQTSQARLRVSSRQLSSKA